MRDKYIIKERLNLKELNILLELLKKTDYKDIYERLNKYLDKKIYNWEYLANNEALTWELSEIFISSQIVKINNYLNEIKFNELSEPQPSKETVEAYILDTKKRMNGAHRGGIIESALLFDLIGYLNFFNLEFINKDYEDLRTFKKFSECYIIRDYNIKIKIVSRHLKKKPLTYHSIYLK